MKGILLGKLVIDPVEDVFLIPFVMKGDLLGRIEKTPRVEATEGELRYRGSPERLSPAVRSGNQHGPG